MADVTESIALAAARDAEHAALRAGVEVRALHDLDDLAEARRVWDAVWPTVPGATEITGNLIKALEHAGSHVGGAFREGRMVGSSLAFVGRTRGEHGWHVHLHSHIAATVPGAADRGIGTALKLHQRAWALEHDIDRIVWTFDPLVRRNARLNIGKLGGTAVEYLVDFYGQMDDAVNAGEPSDRLLLQWDLASDRVLEAVEGTATALPSEEWRALGAVDAVVSTDDGPHRMETDAPVLLVEVPHDIVDLRRYDLGLARAWRLRVREAMEPVLRTGGRVVALTSDGRYVLEAQR